MTVDAYSGERTLRNAWQFLIGKGFTAICTVFLVGFVVRFLALSEYAFYISVVAALETGLVLSSLGIDWVIIRYVPQFVVGGTYSGLKTFIKSMVVYRVISMVVFAGVAAIVTYYLAPILFFGRTIALLLLTALFISEGLLRLLRDNTLESLANQSLTQFGVILRQGLFLALLAGMAATGSSSTVEVVLISELTASLMALSFAIYAVLKTISPLRSRGRLTEWSPPGLLAMRRTAWHNYLSGLLSYPFSAQALVLLIVTINGPSGAALFGFVTRIVEILRGYLPALLLMNVLRPRLFGIYEKTKQFEKPASEARLISGLSFFAIFPVIVITALYGDWFIGVASGGRFQEGNHLLLLLVMSLVFRVQRQMATLLINCVKLSSILIQNAIYSLLLIPVLLALMGIQDIPLFAAVAILWDDVLWTLCSAYFLKSAGFKWSADLALMAKLTCVSLLCFFSLSFIPMLPSLIAVLISSILVTIIFGFYLFVFQPLGADLVKVRQMVFTSLGKK